MNIDADPAVLPGPPPGPLRRLLPRSLAARLAGGVVILVIGVVLAVSLGTYFALQSFLYSRLDQQLQSTASNASLRNLLSPAGAEQPEGLRAPQRVWATALSPGGAELGRLPQSSALAAMQLTPGQQLMLSERTTTDPLTLRTADGVQLRVTIRRGVTFLVTSGTINARTDGIAVIGLSTDEVTKTLGHLVRLELVIGAAAVAVALAASAWGVRFSLRRLRSVTDTAQEVAAELSPEGAGLDRRVPVEDDGTEVGRLAQSMNTLLAAVETQFAARLENERRMRQFLADASHELRTPLTSIRGYAELARMQRAVGEDEPADDAPGSQAPLDDNLARIESEGTRMSRLVEDLLMLARGDQADSGNRPELLPVTVDELIEDVVAGSRAAFPERRILAAPATGLVVVGDQDQLLRAIRNLVGNAATHTNPDGTITLRAFGHGAGVAIQVADQGPGLPPEDAAHVFERFWRADRARTRARGGSGLGLAIVASIVSQHHGTVHFQSTVEHGSVVTVWLPAE